jgi:hypothetical protein
MVPNTTGFFTEEFGVEIRNKVEQYIRSFRSSSEEYNKHIEIKKIHTFRVVKEIVEIGVQLGLDAHQIVFARILALLHDIGRFEQYHKYGTFSDAESENHSEIALRVIKNEAMLPALPQVWQVALSKCILNHNVPTVPNGEGKLVDFFSRLLRDADKLDIWRVALENDIWHKFEKFKKNPHYDIPREIMNCFRKRRIVPVEYAATLHDSYLLRLSWIFDINFKSALQKVKSRNIVERFLSKFFITENIKRVEEILDEYLAKKLVT